MKTLRHDCSYKFTFACFALQIFLALVDCKVYCVFLDGREGNLIEYILFSVNNPYFIALIGAASVFSIMKCFTQSDLLLIFRFENKKKYFQNRLVNCSVVAGIWVVFTVAVRFLIGIFQKYSVSTTFKLKYYAKFMRYSEREAFTVLCLLVFYIFLYLTAMLWIREIVQELTSDTVLCHLLPFVFSALDISVFMSLKYKISLWLPLGNVLIHIDDFISHAIYWGFLLCFLYYVKIEIMGRKEIK